MLRLEHLSLRRGTRVLIQDADLTIHPGWRVGVTGANGTGKSSLFALLRGELAPDQGECSLPSDWVIAHVAQEVEGSERSALDYVMDGDAELRRLQGDLARAEAAGEGARVGELHARLDAIDAWTAESRAGKLLHGLGFGPGDERRPMASFSGGWRMRLNLGRALMCRSDLLLLDEPTNHLDLEAVLWLERWLISYSGTLLLISHDRDFLDRVVTHVAHIEQGGIRLYTGDYSAFELARAEALSRQQALHERQQREIEHMETFVARFRAKASKARQAQSRLKALERMTRVASVHADSPFRFAFREPLRLPDPLLKLDRISGGYGETAVIQGVKYSLHPGARLGLLGPNGAGKSTLIRIMAGDLAPLVGSREPAPDLSVGYFAQHQLEQLDPQASPLLHLQRLDGRAREQELRNFLGGFGFLGDQALAPVEPFSGGEKARLVLALLVWQRPNLLLLDEPTNHLDMDMRHALEQALQDFGGAVVLVSHDRHMLRSVCDDFLLVADGGAQAFEGDLEDYRDWLAARERAQGGGDVREMGGEQGAASRKARKRDEAALRQRLKPLRDQVRRLEREHETLEQEKRSLDEALADPAIYEASARERLQSLLGRQAETARRLAEVESTWLEACEALEIAESAD
ncbi:ATP-binding cassette domain-containing protein [Ectothiorhodospira lacustris]|uniref:ATP-binding cassette domain-containing protein n=1 Tax=Ectothiorhodospira lacustris TaxID=2899127 RepID=UPI001EE907AA|nr:ATP-binding cassette domain-containing protein [Ectothiorhodospira lacustris]MCG5500760.1 ATP-binding cassette domain-containing protein [Ectothiorhodospira lacustris]MCG5510896.1 ATP-binding cassette domain-containing protein [Ectothiorhodospira lacustris]MCG5522558.1 ATP-binding cassette domain-containing protein [Ectothiorhodospira lacustris]